MKRIILIVLLPILFLFTDCKNVIGPSLPDEIIGSWEDDWGYYSRTYEFTKNHVYYSDYASNTGGSSSWDCELDEVLDDNSFIACSDYYYFHISGNTLYLIRESSPQTLASEWWTDAYVAKTTLIKQ